MTTEFDEGLAEFGLAIGDDGLCCDAKDIEIKKLKRERDERQELLEKTFGADRCYDCHCRRISTVYQNWVCSFSGDTLALEGRLANCPFNKFEEKK